MTLFISIFAILMVILGNHPPNSGAVQKLNLRKEVSTEFRTQRNGRKFTKKGDTVHGKKMRGKQDLDFEFKSCDYVDLVEVG